MGYSKNEFRYNPDLKLGDKVEVIVDTREDNQALVLSHRKARVIKFGTELMLLMTLVKLFKVLSNVEQRVE